MSSRNLLILIALGIIAGVAIFILTNNRRRLNYEMGADSELGRSVVVCVTDGTNALPNTLFSGADAATIDALAPDGFSPVAYNVTIVGDLRRGKYLLIDTGNGGDLLAALKEAKISPESVEAILLTHSHADHVNGLLASDGASPAFPNAKVHITAAELDFWKASRPDYAMACEAAYNGFAFITPDEKTQVFPPHYDIVAIDTAGHTPGHVSFLIDRKTFVAGDLLHSQRIQFAHPEVSASFDVDKTQAAAMRRRILERAAAEQWNFTAYHLPNRSPGKVVKQNEGFAFIVDAKCD